MKRRLIRDRSLRFQLVALVLTLLSVSFVAVAAVTALAMRGFLVERLDQQLSQASSRYTASLEEPNDHDADNRGQLGPVEGQSAGTLGARVINGVVVSAMVVAHDADDQTTVTAQDKRVLATQSPGHPRSIHLPGLGDYRVSVTRGDDGDLLVTGLAERPVDETIARLLLIEVTVFATALIVTGVVGTLSARLSLRPLRRVAATAREVSLLPLSTGTVTLPDQVAVTGPHTEAGQVADAFNHMLAHVESALHERHASEDRLRQFIADASHELRTPVSVIRSHAEYAQRVGGQLPDAVAEALGRIEGESDRMGHLVDDLLLLARLDSGRPLAREPVDLTRIVLDAVSDARVISRDHNWRLDLPEHEVLGSGDAHALHQVVANLLANSRTHTPPGTTVTTRVSDADGSTVVVTVADDGPGISAELLPHVFDRFARAGRARNRSDGSGLGLSIVTAIVTAHGGTASVDSRPGSTTFRIELPRTIPSVE
jgi:two-component system, OmpR family, sensor kinase